MLFPFDKLDQWLAAADIVSFHLNTPPTAYPTFAADFFRMLKNGAYIVNTSRAFYLDEQCLVDGLLSNKIAGVALDVLGEAEEHQQYTDSVIWTAAVDSPSLNLILTPHIGGSTQIDLLRVAVGALNPFLKALGFPEYPYQEDTT
jgi:D-3-phosphoglycerate dehydrogenase